MKCVKPVSNDYHTTCEPMENVGEAFLFTLLETVTPIVTRKMRTTQSGLRHTRWRAVVDAKSEGKVGPFEFQYS